MPTPEQMAEATAKETRKAAGVVDSAAWLRDPQRYTPPTSPLRDLFIKARRWWAEINAQRRAEGKPPLTLPAHERKPGAPTE